MANFQWAVKEALQVKSRGEVRRALEAIVEQAVHGVSRLRAIQFRHDRLLGTIPAPPGLDALIWRG